MDWSGTREMLLYHFKDLTVEIVWENGIPVTYDVLRICILLQCVLLNFKKANHFIPDLKTVNALNPFENGEGVYDSILWANFRVLMNVKFTSGEILFIPGVLFPSYIWRNGGKTGVSGMTPLIPILFPTVIVFETDIQSLRSSSPSDLKLIGDFSEALIIFAVFDQNAVKVACFACSMQYYNKQQYLETIWYALELVPVREKSASNFRNLFQYWKSLQMHLKFFNKENGCEYIQGCKSIGNSRDISDEIYRAFFKHTNCSNFVRCLTFYKRHVSLNLQAFYDGSFLSKIFPTATHQSEYTFQVIFPKANKIHTNLDAFLTPFQLTVWISIGLIIFAISIWLIYVEGEDCINVLFWQYAVIFEQNDKQPFQCRFRGKALILLWVFTAVFLRQFYISTLYSFMTKEGEPQDFPKTMEELLNRTDFELISPKELYYTIGENVFFWEQYMYIGNIFNGRRPNASCINSNLTDKYLRIFYKSKFLNFTFNRKTVNDIGDGKSINVYRYVPAPKRISSRLNAYNKLHTSKKTYETKKFLKFAIVCKEACESEWNVANSLSKIFHTIIPKQQKPFLIISSFWIQRRPSFAALAFSGFLDSFVSSGLYGRVTENFQNQRRLVSRHASKNFINSDMENDNGNEVDDGVQCPTKISAFIGTLIIMLCMLVMSFVMLAIEIIMHFNE
ncbi:unnamed protein product [Orchesella dallaii]|uniref:Uncharacterized protein n=1 Tax=Orchesella dallaii TaxID=48710 RepID=A0ABP1PIG1_9HEXA